MPAPSALDAAQAAFNATAEQKAARRRVTQEQNSYAKSVETKRIFAPIGRVWHEHGGDAIDGLLANIDLVDARYLIALSEAGSIIPRWQHLPDSARINRSNVWRLWGWERMFSLGILVLSYPWLDADHPDRQGEMLRRAVPILKQMLPFCGGDEFTVGVLWDYMSLPQPERTPEEGERFTAGLRDLMTWYAHPYTHVLLMTTPLPTGCEYTNQRAYGQRGWCEAERRTCAISKCTHCLWDLAGFEEEALEGLSGMARFDELRKMMRSGRTPPLSPPQFAQLMRSKVASAELSFSAEADVELVLRMYHEGFIATFERYRQFDPQGFFAAYAGLGWGEEEAKQVAAALRFASQNCKMRNSLGPISLRLEGNTFGSAGEKAIQRLLESSKAKMFDKIFF